MGTSNWQNIPFCVEALMKIAPTRVLDVGVGFGRWGMIVREFCDVWYGRVAPESWAVHLEGIEVFPKNITPYHEQFYTRVHLGDAAEFLRRAEDPYDVVIFGDVLEHFPKDVGRELLHRSLELATYTLVNIPLGEEWHQEESYENPYERHLASWTVADFAALPVVRRALFTDYALRPFASIVLSRADPKQLAVALFSPTTSRAADGDGTDPIEEERQRVLRRVAEVAGELDFIKRHASYRLAARVRRSPAWNALRWLRTQNADVVTIRALGTRNERADGAEVWLLAARPAGDRRAIPWDFMEMPDGTWERVDAPNGAFGVALKAARGTLRFPLYAPDPVLAFMTHQWGGRVEIAYRGRRHVVDLYSPGPATLEVSPGREDPAGTSGPGARAVADGDGARSAAPAVIRFSDAEQGWIAELRARRADILAVHVPRWLGVSAATRILFEHVHAFPRSPAIDPSAVDAIEVKREARLILETGIRHLVCSGGERPHYDLVREVKRQAPDVRCDILWHGTYAQCEEDYVWSLLQLWIEAAREGVVHTIGTVKKGMDAFFERLGCRSRFVMNYVPEVPARAAAPAPGGPHLGLWISGYSYRKLPFAMLAAVKMVPGAVLHGSNFVPRMREAVEVFGIDTATVSDRPLPEAALLEAIERTHLSLYVTFSECCPMLPLQSLSVGVPCLTGPTSHLFEDDEFLHRRLVVPYPDRADVIADYIRAALEERDGIVARYAGYVPGYNARAVESVRSFLAD